MDKYEFNIKVEQIKKMVTKNDFETAMKIADTIDWRRVRSANLLSMISQVYEKSGEYGEAKEVLLLAYERAPVGKRLLYKLTELALKEGSIREAEDYYREFCDLAQDDPRQYLLRYMILKEKKAKDEQLVACLERYVGQELDEKWMYELASLYAKAGQQQKCVQMCDRIMLMFGFGKYVDKAMDLKVHYAPLSAYQLDLMQNRDKYEAKLKAVEQEYNEDIITGFDEPYKEEPVSQNNYSGSGYSQADNVEQGYYQQGGYGQEYPEGVYPIERYRTEQSGQNGYSGSSYQEAGYNENYLQGNYQEEAYRQGEYQEEVAPGNYSTEEYPQETYGSGEYMQEGYPQDNYGQGEYRQEEYPQEAYDKGEYMQEEYSQEVYDKGEYMQEEYPQDNYGQENYAQESYSEEGPYNQDIERPREEITDSPVERDFDETGEESDSIDEDLVVHLHQADMEQELAREMSKISAKASFEQEPKSMQTKVPHKTRDTAPIPVAEELPENLAEELPHHYMPNHFMIEARNPEEGFEAAINILKKIHLESGSNNQVAKISGSKLNQRGMWDVAEKLVGRDLVIEEAGDLNNEELLNLQQFISEDTTGMNVILIDNPRQMEELYQQNPEFTTLFECIHGEQIPLNEEGAPMEEEDQEPIEEEELPIRKPEIPAAPPTPVRAKFPEEEFFEPEPVDDEEMDIDQFADYATRYAGEIDCSITGKSMLALYERIEIMEEDGIPLTKANAEELIEEAADKAEKPSLGRLITGMFSSKYDKEGLLILREEHFI